MDADRDGGAPAEAPLADRTNFGAGPATARVQASGWVPSFGGVGQKRPLAEGRGAAAEPFFANGSGDEPSGGDEDALRDDDDDAVPLSVAELYHEDDEDARPARESRDESVRQYEAASSNLDASNAPPEAHPVCPVCALRLADVADTPLARVAHVNACLDANERARSRGDQTNDAPQGVEEAAPRDDGVVLLVLVRFQRIVNRSVAVQRDAVHGDFVELSRLLPGRCRGQAF